MVVHSKMVLVAVALAAAAVHAGGVRWIDGAELPSEGAAFADAPTYARIPPRFAGVLPQRDIVLGSNTAGRVIRFVTDSRKLRFRWALVFPSPQRYHMTMAGTSGIDVYRRTGEGPWRAHTGRYRLVPTGACNRQGEYSYEMDWTPGDECMLYLPNYNGIARLALGVDEGADVWKGPPHRGAKKPVVIFGHSITQGGCASRAGLAWTAVVGRRIDVEIVNLGLSGSAWMEIEWARALGETDPALFVLDTSDNQSLTRVKERYEAFLRELNGLRPGVPIVILENTDVHNYERKRSVDEAIREIVERLVREDPKRWAVLEIIPHAELVADDEGTVDGIHLNDLGMRTVADAVERRLLPHLERSASKPRLVFHLDFNSAQLNAPTVSNLLERVAAYGYDAILWEIEDKVRWACAPSASEAFTKPQFRALLAKAKSLGLEPIPLMQTFGHAEYVLTDPRFAALREDPKSNDCYCVSRPETRRFLRTLLGEYLDLFGPDVRWFHLGGDEVYRFCTCPTCRHRPPVELYAEHLKDVAQDLLSRGVRPGVWSDMLFAPKNAADAGTVPCDFMIWFWDYRIGNGGMRKWTERLSDATRLGFDIVFAGASASHGDGPFLPLMREHRRNLAACADLVRSRSFAGLCVTSWSIRQVQKELQLPLADFAARRLRSPADDAEADWRAALDRCGIGLPAERLDGLCAWRQEWLGYDGRSWRQVKDAQPPPTGWSRGKAARARGGAADALAAREKTLGDASEGLPERWREAVALQRELAGTALGAVRKEAPGDLPVERTRNYLGIEQTPASASNATEIIWAGWR